MNPLPHLLKAMADGPWWAWPATLVVALAAGLAVAWAIRYCVRAVFSAVQSAATGDAHTRERIGAWMRQRFMTVLFGVVVAIVIGLSAQTLVGWLLGIGMSPMWARLAFVAFDGMAVMLALTLWRRVERGESAGTLRVAMWGLVAASSYFCSQHAPAGNLPAAIAYALFPIVAALGLEVLLQEQRRDRSWLRRQAGEEQNRRLALVRWLHPVERARVTLMLATDEYMGAEAATREVRVQNAALAVFRLRQLPRWAAVVVAAERRAQRALARAGVGQDEEAMADVLRRVQVLTQAGRIARLNYASPDQARQVVGSLITREALSDRIAVGPAPGSEPVGSHSETGPAVERTGARKALPESNRSDDAVRSDEPDRGSDRSAPERSARESDPVRTGQANRSGAERQSEPVREQSGGRALQTDPVADRAVAEVADGSGQWRVKETKPEPVREDPTSIRSVDGKSGPHRSMDDLKADMTDAVRSGRLDRNTVDAIVTAVRTGKPRARKLREWADETGLFSDRSDDERTAERSG